MVDYLKALYVNGRIVTGLHHGEAFSKLTEEEKNSADLLSGFWNKESGFLAEELVVPVDTGKNARGVAEPRQPRDRNWTKRIILIRHSKVMDGDNDPRLSPEGHWWAEAMAAALSHEIDLSAFSAYASPYRRCLETSYHVLKHSGIMLQVDPRLAEAYSPPFHEETAADLIRRVGTLIESLPACSVLFSHCNLIGKLVQLICGDDLTKSVVPLASITYIVNHKIVFFGRKEHNEEVCNQGWQNQWRN